MTYLVDANVLSEATNPVPHPGVVAWLLQNERDIAVDPIVHGLVVVTRDERDFAKTGLKVIDRFT